MMRREALLLTTLILLLICACNYRMTSKASAVTATGGLPTPAPAPDRKSTRLNSSHLVISYAVFCLKKNKSTLQNSWRLLLDAGGPLVTRSSARLRRPYPHRQLR